MTQEIERVIVPLDAASETGTAIDTAAHLAARWRVPLHGLFIEDEELIDLAGLPFARQVTLGAGLELLTKDHIEDYFDAGSMKRLDHFLEFAYLSSPVAARAISWHRREIAQGVIPPVIPQSFFNQVSFIDEMMNGQ